MCQIIQQLLEYQEELLDNLNHRDIPDPILQRLHHLQSEINKIKKKLKIR